MPVFRCLADARSHDLDGDGELAEPVAGVDRRPELGGELEIVGVDTSSIEEQAGEIPRHDMGDQRSAPRQRSRGSRRAHLVVTMA